MAFGSLDAAVVALLAWRASQPSAGLLHALALFCCALVAGIAGSYLRSVQDRLAEANRDLATKNRQLAEGLRAQEAVRREQDLALAQLREGEKRYRGLLERVQDAVLIIQDGRVAYANQPCGHDCEAPPRSWDSTCSAWCPAYRRELWEQYCRWRRARSPRPRDALSTRKGQRSW